MIAERAIDGFTSDMYNTWAVEFGGRLSHLVSAVTERFRRRWVLAIQTREFPDLESALDAALAEIELPIGKGLLRMVLRSSMEKKSRKIILFDDVIPFLNGAKAKRYKMGIASNADGITSRLIPEIFSRWIPDELVLMSYRVGESLLRSGENYRPEDIPKPSPIMLNIAIREFGKYAWHYLHFDDRLDGVDAAQAAGMHPVLIKRGKNGGLSYFSYNGYDVPVLNSFNNALHYMGFLNDTLPADPRQGYDSWNLGENAGADDISARFDELSRSQPEDINKLREEKNLLLRYQRSLH